LSKEEHYEEFNRRCFVFSKNCENPTKNKGFVSDREVLQLQIDEKVEFRKIKLGETGKYYYLK
jgi:hypothetical protein